MELAATWKGTGAAAVSKWACTDKWTTPTGTAPTTDGKTTTPPSNNCMINGAKSNLTIDTTKKANLSYHWHRPFAVASTTNDLQLSVGQTYSVKFNLSGLGPKNYKNWSGVGSMKLVEPTIKSGARAMGMSLLVSIFALASIIA